MPDYREGFRENQSDAAFKLIGIRETLAGLASALTTLSGKEGERSQLQAQVQEISRDFNELVALAGIENTAPPERQSPLAAFKRLSIDESHQLIYSCWAMDNIVHLAQRAAKCEAPVLVTGETGVGKELIVRLIHYYSQRNNAPFVPFNCAAAPRDIFESLLFGHKQGAFTGATRNHDGVVRASAGGTLFLDELGELPLELQPKLLRFLQEGEILPLGEKTPSLVNVRIVASSNRNLEAEVSAGQFRADLYYRLNTITLVVPPLRERREDIPALIDYFRERCASVLRRAPICFTQEALDYLSAYDWPGNVRELSNLILRLAALSGEGNSVLVSDLQQALAQQRFQPAQPLKNEIQASAVKFSAHLTLAEAVEQLERQKVREAMVDNNMNFSKAARQLGLSTFGLQKKFKRLFPDQSDLLKSQRSCQPS